MKRFFLTAICISMVSALSWGGPVIRKIIPVASDDNVRIELRLKPGMKEYGFHATITPHKDGVPIWDGDISSLGEFISDTTFVCTIKGLKPELWSPVTPNLYDLEVSCRTDTSGIRFGFRKFEMRDGNFLLNGKPIFLRGNAINPPHRGIPEKLEDSKEFARDYIRFLKGMNINIIRIPDSQNWMDVCDEEGMMIFGGRYGKPKGSTETAPPEDIDKAVSLYKEKELGAFTSHPSVMIYILSNETPYKGKAGERYRSFLSEAYNRLKEWDHTRLYICNAGYGLGRSADIYDVHRYWGWYYNSFLTYLNMRDMDAWQNPGKVQPVTFTECVGNYTGIDGRYNICSRTKQPGSQKCWTGHLPEDRQAEAALGYQAFVLKNAVEMFRRFRPHNSRLSGIMPFTIMFHNWDGISSFAEMKPKPAAYQYGKSYQPILLSWELWQYNAIEGGTISPTLHIVNDDDQGRDLAGAKAIWKLTDLNREVLASGKLELPDISYYGTFRKRLDIRIPGNVRTGNYRLTGEIISGDGKRISENDAEIFIASSDFIPEADFSRTIRLYDPHGNCADAFKMLGIPYETVSSFERLSSRDVLVIAEYAWTDEVSAHKEQIRRFTEKGGRTVCLRQNGEMFDWSWINSDVKSLRISNNDPTYLSPEYTYADGMNINLEKKDHMIFNGLDQTMFRLWSDYTGFDESKEGFPKIYPVTDGFIMRNADQRKAVIYANYSRNLSGTALAEFISGEGSVIVSGFDLTSRCGCDPVAARLLKNIVSYAASKTRPEAYPETGHTVIWGSYESEKGLVTGCNNGLVINPYPHVPADREEEYVLKVDDLGYHYVVSYGGWNNRPGVQYIPRGRRPFAPFGYSAGGNDTVAKKDRKCGEGYFLAKIPADANIMVTTFENNSDETIPISISLNDGPPADIVIPPHSIQSERTALTKDRNIKVSFKGDRRTVILKTEFIP